MEGRIEQLFLAQEKRSPMLPVAEAEAIARRGFKGCRHAGRAPGGKRQVLLLDTRSLEALDLAPGAIKENVLVSGLPLESYEPGQRLGLGPEVIVEITEGCVPCQRLNELRPGLLKEAWRQRGQLAQVIAGGRVRAGDAVRVLEVNPDAPKKPYPKLPR